MTVIYSWNKKDFCISFRAEFSTTINYNCSKTISCILPVVFYFIINWLFTTVKCQAHWANTINIKRFYVKCGRCDTRPNDIQHEGIIYETWFKTLHTNTLCQVSLGRMPLCWVLYFIYCNAECRNDEYTHAECCYAECFYAECFYAECCHAECRYAECRYVDCHGA